MATDPLKSMNKKKESDNMRLVTVIVRGGILLLVINIVSFSPIIYRKYFQNQQDRQYTVLLV